MNRRLPNSRATVALTGGDDRPALPCHNASATFDALVETTRRPDYDEQVLAARHMCATHLLNDPTAARACLDGARDERWRAIVLGRNVRSDTTPDANRAKSAAATKKWDMKRAARLADLRDFIALGVTLDEMPGRLGCSPAALEKWCRKYALAEWRQLNPPSETRGNQHHTTPLGKIALRRGRKSRAKAAA